MKLTPKPNIVIFKKIGLEQTLGSGLIVASKEAETRSIIEIIHPDTSAALGLVAGDEIVHNQFSPNELRLDGSTVYAIHIDDILGKVTR